LNHDSDDPQELFDYLLGYGQSFYNQFDMDFSSTKNIAQELCPQLDPFAALNLIFIFKEAMTNVVKHSKATEVKLSMITKPGKIIFALIDNGTWNETTTDREHYGLQNIRKRSQKNNFEFSISSGAFSTRIEVAVPCTT